MLYDIIIVGAGPAGLTAALYALRSDKRILLLEKETFGGQITFSPLVENYPSHPKISGNELAQLMLDQVMELGADIELAEVTEILNHPSHKTVITDIGQFDAKAVILATGSKHRPLGLEMEQEWIGKGISYCAVCDGAFFAKKDVAIVGGGNTALQEAMLLSDLCRHVTVIQNLSSMTGEARLVSALQQKSNVSFVFDTVVTALIGTDALEEIVLYHQQEDSVSALKVDGLFVAIGQAPENDRFADLIRLDNVGYVVSGEDCLTDIPGIFAAGDCRTKTVRQITTATGDGAVAALAACRYIDQITV